MSDHAFLLYPDYDPKCQDPLESKKLEAKIEQLEHKITRLDEKLDKLIESNRCLINYFSSQGVRELNYNLRSYNSKKAPPINFVPTHMP